MVNVYNKSLDAIQLQLAHKKTKMFIKVVVTIYIIINYLSLRVTGAMVIIILYYARWQHKNKTKNTAVK